MDGRSVIRWARCPHLRRLARVPLVLGLILLPAFRSYHGLEGIPRSAHAFLHASRNEAAERRWRWERVRREAARVRTAPAAGEDRPRA